MINQINIREATIEDVDSLQQLIKELAIYEKNTATISKDKLIKHGFSENPLFYALLVEHKNIAIAYAVYYYQFKAVYGEPILFLEDLYVQKNMRRQGIAKKIILKLQSIAKEKECSTMQWHAYKWNKLALDFYQSIGAKVLDQDHFVALEIT